MASMHLYRLTRVPEDARVWTAGGGARRYSVELGAHWNLMLTGVVSFPPHPTRWLLRIVASEIFE